MSEDDVGDKPKPRQLFPQDEMSTGQTSRLRTYARGIIGLNQQVPQARVPRTAPKFDVKALARKAEISSHKVPAGRSAKPTTGEPADTFVRRKMVEADQNLPRWDDDDPVG